MIRKTYTDVPFYEFEIFQDFRSALVHAVFTRKTNPNDGEFIKAVFETQTQPVSFKKQLHGIEAHINPTSSECEGDILISQQSETPLVIRIADCSSILIFDPVNKVIANVHAGWRGLEQRIIRKTIQLLTARFGSRPKNLLVGVSPMIGPCCSRFSDPMKELPKFLHSCIGEENFVNLWGVVEGNLRECGIQTAHIENPRICTSCNPEEFFSFRREGDTGRFCAAIMLK